MGLKPRRTALLYGPRTRAAASASFYPARWRQQSVSTTPGRPPEHTTRTLMSLKTFVCLYLLFRGRVVPRYRKLRPDEEEWAIYYLWHLLSPLRERIYRITVINVTVEAGYMELPVTLFKINSHNPLGSHLLLKIQQHLLLLLCHSWRQLPFTHVHTGSLSGSHMMWMCFVNVVLEKEI